MHDDPRPDIWLTCSQCHHIMLPLASYEIQASAEPGVEVDFWQMLLFGWWSIVFNYFFGKAKIEGEKQKLAQQKSEVLPQFPNSQICPKCFHVEKSK
jgi:hypothetical protein